MPRIMIVEDDITSVKLLRILLEEVHGFQVSFARRGSEVAAMAQQDNPDVFLIDYHLIDMDGLELIESLRKTEQFAKTPIVMASGMDVEKEALAAGANSFLTKPYEPDDLSNLFKTLTAKAEPAKPEPPKVEAATDGAAKVEPVKDETAKGEANG